MCVQVRVLFALTDTCHLFYFVCGQGVPWVSLYLLFSVSKLTLCVSWCLFRVPGKLEMAGLAAIDTRNSPSVSGEWQMVVNKIIRVGSQAQGGPSFKWVAPGPGDFIKLTTRAWPYRLKWLSRERPAIPADG